MLFLLASSATWGALTACQGFSGDAGVTDRSDGSSNVPVDGSTTSDDDASVDIESGIDSDSSGYVDPDGPGDPSCPQGRGPKMFNINGLCVDQTEVTVGQYATFHKDPASTSVTRPSVCGGVPITAAAAGVADTFPVTLVHWCDAQAFCGWANKRLCSEAERSNAGCNPGPANSACNLGPDSTARAVRSSPDCNANRLWDMVGNVEELTSTLETSINATPHVIVRWAGGAYSTSPFSGICAQGFYEHYKDKDTKEPTNELYRAPDLGFRCCADPKK